MVSKLTAQAVVNLAAGIAAAWGDGWESAGTGDLLSDVEYARITHPDSGAAFLVEPAPYRGKAIIIANSGVCMTPELNRKVSVNAERFSVEVSALRPPAKIADELVRKGAVLKAQRIAAATAKGVRIHQKHAAETSAVVARLVAAGGSYARPDGQDEVSYWAGDIRLNLRIGADTVMFTGRNNRMPVDVAEALLTWLGTKHSAPRMDS